MKKEPLQLLPAEEASLRLDKVTLRLFLLYHMYCL